MRNPGDKRFLAKPWWRPMLTIGLATLVAFAGGWLLGMNSFGTRATAAPPQAGAVPQVAPLGPEPSLDYTRRVVARIYGNVDITREELGEYLIARYGAEKVDLLVNKRIIEHECREKGIDVGPVEVDATLDQDCRDLGVDRKIFIEQVLHQYKKTLYEWKEDVLKPRIMMSKYCQDRVQATEDDLHQAFERDYGEKVEARILLYGPDQEKIAFKVFEQVRSSDEEFERAARTQPNPQLAAKGGEIQPICRFSGNDKIEQVAFSLQPGEVSQVMREKEGFIILKCVRRLPPDRSKLFENERDAMKREVLDKKTQEAIGKVFVEMKAKADPVNYLKPTMTTMADLNRGVKEAMADDSPKEKQPSIIIPTGSVTAPK